MSDKAKKIAEARAKLDAAAAMIAKAANPNAADGVVTVGVTSPDLVAQIKGLEATVRELEAAQRARPGSVTAVEVKEPTAENFSLVKILAKTDARNGRTPASIFDAKGWEDAPNELAVLRKGWMAKYAPAAKTWAEAEAVTKAMSFHDTASAGGLVPTTLMSEIVGTNRSLDAIGPLGVRRMTGLVGNVEQSVQTGGTTFRPQSENPGSNPTVDDLTYTKIQLSPKTFIGHCKLSNQLMYQAGSVIEAQIRDDLGGAYVESRNSNLLVGTGVGGYPLGVVNRATGAGQNLMNTQSLAGALSVAAALFHEMRVLIRLDKNSTANLKWAMNPADWSDINRAGAGMTTAAPVAGTISPPLFTMGDPTKGVPSMLIGYPVVECDELTAGTLVLGDWSRVYWGEWSAVSLAMSDIAGDAFLQNQTFVRMIYDCDVAVAKPSALCLGTSFSV